MNSQLKAGLLDLSFNDGFLRYIRYGDIEVVRMIYFAFRDKNWETLPLRIQNVISNQSEDSFTITYDAINHFRGKDILKWRVKITGTANNTIDFFIRGECLHEFQKNRAGICLLHPIPETQNRDVLVKEPDGTETKGKFPMYIKPDAPFENIQTLKWHLPTGNWATAEFKGDVFEMEDQRNWSDASFKTFCTPQHLLKPVTLEQGNVFTQQIILTVENTNEVKPRAKQNDVNISLDESSVHPFPQIGAMSVQNGSLPDQITIERLKELQFDFLRVDANFSGIDWEKNFLNGLSEAELLRLPIELCITLHDNPLQEIDEIKMLCSSKDIRLNKIIFYSSQYRATPDDLVKLVLPLLRKTWPGIPIGAGSNINFVDLNRNRIDDHELDFISYSINPQAHATDDLTLIENLSSQADTVLSAKQFTQKPVCVSPVTLRPRFSPNKIGENIPDPISLPIDVDHRQATNLAAGWAMGSIKYLVESGVSSITMFETHGMKGFLSGANDEMHSLFKKEDDIFPLFNMFKKIRKFNPVNCIRTGSSQPLVISSILLSNEKERILMLANHTKEDVHVSVGLKSFIVKANSIYNEILR
jgi:hypothetical protein